MIGNVVRWGITECESRWTPHPDPEVDLCALPLAGMIVEAAKKGSPLYIRKFDESFIPNSEEFSALTALEQIVMVGYPIGLWDSSHNQPIFRLGVTATHPKLDFQGREEFLIDAACFPGSSGSPVLLYKEDLTLAPRTTPYPGPPVLTVGPRLVRLLGVLFAGPIQAVEGEIKPVPIPTQMKPLPVSEIPINLGYVIKAERILEFKRLFTQ